MDWKIQHKKKMSILTNLFSDLIQFLSEFQNLKKIYRQGYYEVYMERQRN